MQVIQSVKLFFETYKKIIIAVILFIIADIFLGIRFANSVLSIGTAKENGYYYIDINGKMVNSEAYMEEGIPFSKEGVAYAKGIPLPGKSYGTEGFINKKGKIIKEKLYSQIRLEDSFSFPLIIKENDMFKLIDKDMNVIAEQPCDGMKGIWGCYSDASGGGLYLVSVESSDSGMRCGYMKANLEWAIEPKFSGAFVFSEDKIAAVQDPETGLWGYIDLDGKYISDERYYKTTPFSGGYALVQKEKNGKGAYINTKGEYITDYVFDFYTSQVGFSEGLACVKYADKGGFGYINEQGDIVIEPRYREAGAFVHGLAPVKETSFKYIDKHGNTVIEGDFYWANHFSEDGYAAVIQDGKYGIIDTSGDWLFEPQFATRRPINWEDGFEDLGQLKGLDVTAPNVENGYCIVCLEKGQRIKKTKRNK